MAKAIHVKAHKPWKRLEIPKGSFDNNIFDGLVDLQELTDYEFIKTDPSASKKNRKRSAGNDADIDSSGSKKKKMEEPKNVNAKLNKKNEDEDSDQKKLKKKKGKSRKKKTEQGKIVESNSNVVDGCRLEDISGTISNTEVEQKNVENSEKDTKKKKKGKSRKKKNVRTSESQDESVSNDMLKNSPIGSGSEKNEKSKSGKNKKKRRKKAKSAEESVTLVESDLLNVEKDINQNCDLDMSKWSNLFVPEALLRSLQEQGFQNPTTIQTLALPSAIRDMKDILAAAETGSGKTLAFGIPVLSKVLERQEQYVENEEQTNIGSQNEDDSKDGDDVDMHDEKESDDDDDDELESSEHPDINSEDDNANDQDDEDFNFDDIDYDADSDVKENISDKPPQVLILEPTRELAVQVHNHLSKLAKHTNINFATVVGGMSVDKQRRLLKRLPEVIIATPGRLWQLIEEGDGHLSQIDLIHSLVVDEADRMVEKGHYEELTLLLEMINTSPRRDAKRQSFVMSATLTMQVAIPKRLLNKKKEKDLEKDKLKKLTKKICLGTKPKVFDLTPKDKTAQSLTEMRINCSKDEKDYYLYYFLSQHPGRTLVFANSKDCLRRLVSVFNLLERSPYPLHADMQQRQRLKNLDRFSANEKGLLLASDVAARGLDIPNVDYVIHYQVPYTKENYVHRSGRTARASNVGLSVMLVAPEDAKNYNKIVQGVKHGEDVPLLPVDGDLLPAVKNRVNLARTIDVAQYRNKKIRLHNDFFTKAAEEMDMIVDEIDLAPTEDAVVQAEEKNRMKGMKFQLSSMLKGSLAPLRMTKYPTKSGKLVSMKSVDLLKAT